ncbi:hypothetical protein BJF93_23285 [Xaviernesmea oryzae]|uniref:DoxX family protein n=1 Tax=Xaviernesmea oryzae TaxID=464029 RepID=A0A1Q9AU55_9HYPH|nr:hypothetical protein [Xaviernesmea oryzae]OLP58946.1 hypothetical protein BJF93_23285 [Xaviernesmea oryzae]SEM00868.1 hypothetical protein SAMN04487976_1179 [Xaviernesmea oryzae]
MKRVLKGVLPILQAGLGAFWLYSGVTKVWSGFDARPFLQATIEKAQAQSPAVLPFMGRIVSEIALPAEPFINIAIPWLEIVVALGFLVSVVDQRIRRPTLALAGFLSVLFLACGAGGWNPFLLGVVLALALAERTQTPKQAAATPPTLAGT